MRRERDLSSAVPSGVRRSAHPPPAALPAAFYARGAAEVARDLLGARLVAEIGGARVEATVVETEAYTGPDDEASHAHRRFGRTARNAVMFGPPGIAYVYRIYGMHWCLNAVTGPDGFPAAVLLRAARVEQGIDAVRERRPGRADPQLLRGPGNLCRGLGVGGEHNHHPLAAAPLWIAAGAPVPDTLVRTGPRIGISRAADRPLRFWVSGEPAVSR